MPLYHKKSFKVFLGGLILPEAWHFHCLWLIRICHNFGPELRNEEFKAKSLGTFWDFFCFHLKRPDFGACQNMALCFCYFNWNCSILKVSKNAPLINMVFTILLFKSNVLNPILYVLWFNLYCMGGTRIFPGPWFLAVWGLKMR